MTEQEIPAGEFPEDAGSHIADEDKDETPETPVDDAPTTPEEGDAA